MKDNPEIKENDIVWLNKIIERIVTLTANHEAEHKDLKDLLVDYFAATQMELFVNKKTRK